MTLPGWSVEGRAHRHDGYTIEPAPDDGPGWILHATDAAHPVLASIDDVRFSSLKAAKSAAIHHRLRVIRRTKMIRHAVLAAAGIIVVVPAYVLLVPEAATPRIGWFVLGLAIVLVTLREIVELTMLLISDGWDYAYDTPRLTWLDRAVADVVSAVAGAPRLARDDGHGEDSVHVVGIEEAGARR